MDKSGCQMAVFPLPSETYILYSFNMWYSVLVMQIEEKSNQLEVTLCYYPGNPEEGEAECLTIGVTKVRMSIGATRESEQKNGVYLR